MPRKRLTAGNEKTVLPRLSAALRKLATAASGQFGADCYLHAAIGQEILGRLGIIAKIVAGHSAWRVSNRDPDVIVHAPMPNMPPQPGGVPYHVWLEVDDHILDFTIYQLRAKAKQLDALDGGKTKVDWCPDYLFAPKSAVSSLREVTMKHAGLYFYLRSSDIERLVFGTAPDLDMTGVEAVWLLCHNLDMCVLGPNNMAGKKKKNRSKY